MVRRVGTGVVMLAVAAAGQTHRVEKPEAVVRAVGVYEWTGELVKPTASRLIPVTVFINGELEDGAVYQPRPIPFALLPGNEYVLQQAGVEKGLLVLNSASKTAGADEGATDGWWGYGTFQSLQAEKAAKLRVLKDESRVTAPKEEEAPESRKGDPDRPTLRRRSGQGGKDAKTDSSASSGGTKGADAGVPADDPDRPVLKKRGGATGGDEGKASAPAASPSDAQEVATEALNRDPNRPVLHRGKPANGGVADTPDAAVGAKLMSGGTAGGGKAVQQMVAVSDAKNRPEHNFARAWDDAAEQKAVQQAMEAIARARLAAYVPGGVPGPGAPRAGALVGQSGDAAPAAGPDATGAAKRAGTGAAGKTAAARARARAAAARKAAATPPPVPLLDEDLRGYELSYGGAPTFVLTAHTGGTGEADRYVTVVAQRDLQGALQPAFGSVTDAAHLDRVAAMRLVGAVDAEASNRASLVFELREPAGRQFALLRVLGGRSETIFTTGVTP